jgi:glycosyltransferase involved in cell wall biosynthesis
MATQLKELGKIKVAFFTVVFPKNEKFILKFLSSLNNQSFKKFDLIVVNDKLNNFEEYKNKFIDLNIIDINSTFSQTKNRELGINYCIENNYDILIFGDSDDYFENNRIEKSIELLKSNDIVVNDLTLFSKNIIYQKKYLSQRLKNYQKIDFEFIRNKNIFGLSNTAIKLRDLSKVELPENLVALDWYIFSKFLMDGKKAIFTNETISYYRQHDNNTIGLKELDELSFKIGLNVKIQHYKALNKIHDNFEVDLNMLLHKDFAKKKIDFPLWWEQI